MQHACFNKSRSKPNITNPLRLHREAFVGAKNLEREISRHDIFKLQFGCTTLTTLLLPVP